MSLIFRLLLPLMGALGILSSVRGEEAFPQVSINGHIAYIIPESAAPVEWKRMFGIEQPGQTGYWTPNIGEIEAAEKVIRHTLHKAIKNPSLAFPYRAQHPEKFPPNALKNSIVEIKKVDQHIDVYQAQYLGLIVNGRKQIFANYFDLGPLREIFGPDHQLSDPAEILVEVCDGGYHFWHLQFEMESKKFINFDIDGPWESDFKK